MASPDEQRTSQSRTTVQVKTWVTKVITEHKIALQRLIIRFLLWAYGFLLVVTMGIFVLQGFKLWGFQLDSGLMKWLGGATLGEIGGLLTLTFGAVFKNLKD
jgi:hypothetical protein